MKYHHLFFDLDHTLWDFDTASKQCWQELYQRYQLAAQGLPDFDTFFLCYCRHNDRLWERFRAGFMKREDLRWKRIWYTLLDFKVYQTELAQELSVAYLDLLPTQAVLMPGAREVLDYCSPRYSLHLITNGFEKTQRLKLQYSGIEHYFKEIFCSERCNSIKPQVEIFQFALRETGATLSESLMIGDALDIDVLGASNAGMDSVYFNPSGTPHQGKPTYEIARLQDLIPLL